MAVPALLEHRPADGCLVLTLGHPPANVLNTALLESLAGRLMRAASDETVRLLVLTAGGDRYFSAGVDVAEHTAPHVEKMLSTFHDVARQLHAFPLPTVAVLNGDALGGGLELALACDMRLAAEGVRLGQPEIRLGVFAPVAAILLPRLLSAARASELLLGGGLMTAQEARECGLLNRVFPREQLAAGVEDFLQPFLGLSRVAQIQNKQAIREAGSLPFADALNRLEARYLGPLMATADAREGLAAFMEKRPACWQHR